MARLGELDLPDRFWPRVPRIVTQVFVAILCTAAAFLARGAVDVALPSAGPFALTFPSVLLATLFARAFAGVLTQIMCAFYAWYFVLPVHGSFAFEVASDGPRVVVNVLSGFLIVILAEIFRRAVRRAVAEREEALERRDLYLQEFDHRVKNNFAMVASLLDMQRRQVLDADPRSADILSQAAARVDSIARAHRSLYRGDGLPTLFDMQDYLTELRDTLEASLTFSQGVRMRCDAERVWLPRDRAIAIGLLVNELATNAVKHAFPADREGLIAIAFHKQSDGNMCLVVADDGVGIPRGPARDASLGQRLIDAFAAQAGGKLRRESSPDGTRFVLDLDAEETV